jgi:uncharacterized membrane protein YfcA
MPWPQIPPGVEPAVYYLCVGAAVVLIGISKAGFGGGMGIVAIPLMAMVMPAPHMLGLMLPLLIAADILSNLHHLRAYEWRFLRPLLLGAAGGILLGSAAFWALRQAEPARFQRWTTLLVGTVCLAVVGLQAWGLTGRSVQTLPSRPASSVGVGGLAGFVSTLAHSAGPLVSLYLLQEKVEKKRLVGTLVLFFLLVNVAKVPTFVALGTINGATLRDSIWFIPLLPVGTLAGAWMNRRIPEKPFVLIMYAAAAVTAGHMIYKSI